MKKIAALICAITLASVGVFAQTNVSGTISSNTTWNLAGSPYTVVSTVSVSSGVTLTIDDGVEVNFNSGTGLNVTGTLTASGTVFSANTGSPSKGYWGYVYFGNGTNSGSSSITNSVFTHGSVLYVRNAYSVTLTGTTITEFNTGLYVESTGAATLDGATVSSNTQGIYNYGTVTLTGSTVVSNITNTGLTMGSGSTNNVNGASFSGCNNPIHYENAAHLFFTGSNSISGNTRNAITVAYYYQSSGNYTWPEAPVPYYLASGVQIQAGAKLTIAPGNIIKMLSTGIYVYGSLIADGTAAKPIYFTSWYDDNWGGDTNEDASATAPTNSQWYGINFYDNSVDTVCSVSNAQIRYANSGIETNDASPVIDSCVFTSNIYGVSFKNASYPTFTNNSIGSSSSTPIAMSMEADPVFENNTFSFQDNTYDAIGIYSGTLTADATLKIRSVTNTTNVTYLLLGTLTVPSGRTLTINKGIVIKTVNSSIVIEGKLLADGASDSLIVITSYRDDNHGNPGDTNKDGTISNPTVGDFGGIYFANNSDPNSLMDFVVMNYASPYSSYYSSNQYMGGASVMVMNSTPTISNCTITNAYYGIKCYQASNPLITNTSFVNINYAPISVSASADPTITGASFTNCGWSAMGLMGGDVTTTGTIKKRNVAGYTNITYVLFESMTIKQGTQITIQDGIVIKNNGNTITVEGGLKFSGTTNSKIIWTSLNDDNFGNPFDTNNDGNGSSPTNGQAGYLNYSPTSDDNFCTMQHTEYHFAGGAITMENANPTFNNVLVNKASGYGFYIAGTSAPNISNTTVQNCTSDPVAMSLLSDPVFGSGVAFSANASKALRIIEGTLSTSATLEKRNVAGISNIAYLVNHIVIDNAGLLTINPGVVVKFVSSGLIGVYGGLEVLGTSSEKVIFTSYYDDSAGGDSNNDGNNSQPSQGQAGGLVFYNSSDDSVNVVSHCELRYSGSSSGYINSGVYSWGAIKIYDAFVDISDVVIQYSSSSGIGIYGSANPSIDNVDFYNITYEPVYMSMFANPSFGNVSMQNIGITAIGIAEETYSQNATIPLRDFGPYTNITYVLHGYYGSFVINNGTTITFPAGLKMKSDGINISVNGAVKVLGTVGNPVYFGPLSDDGFGTPADAQQNGNTNPSGGVYFNFNDVSNDTANLVEYAQIRYASTGITCTSASPTIRNCTFEKNQYGVVMEGVSEPLIENNTFHNLSKTPIAISLVAFPASYSGNIISGTTYKAIRINDESLTQDVTLPKRNFGGFSGIPYIMGNYTIGTSAVLTIEPGVVCKFENYGVLYVHKGLFANGGSGPDSTIVFTSIYDDFYGGDTNSDSTATNASQGYWLGLVIESDALDNMLEFSHCAFGGANYWSTAQGCVRLSSASAMFDYCSFSNSNNGIVAVGSANPVIHNCDFFNITDKAIYNQDQTFVIDATNNWWGNSTGPTHSGNPGGTGESVSDAVDYDPWLTEMNNPLMGDVSLNGVVQAYDASLILKDVVNSITLSDKQQMVADVSGNASITAYDASLVLQYVVGLLQSFPAEQRTGAPATISTDADLNFGQPEFNGNSLQLPVIFAKADLLKSSEFVLTYNPLVFQYNGSDLNTFGFTVVENNTLAGEIRVAAATANSFSSDEFTAVLSFTLLGDGNITSEQITLHAISLNDVTVGDRNIHISNSILNTNHMSGSTSVNAIYPNPSGGMINIALTLENMSQVSVELLDLTGRRVKICFSDAVSAGQSLLNLQVGSAGVEAGYYYIQVIADGEVIQVSPMVIR